MFQAALDNHQPGCAMSMFNTSSPQHDRSLAEIKQWFPAFEILRWFEVHELSAVLSPIDLLGPAVILACTSILQTLVVLILFTSHTHHSPISISLFSF